MANSSKYNSPYLPVPPVEYDQNYFSEVVRALSLFMQSERNPGPSRNTTLVLTELPTSPTGLEVGSVWNDSGTLKVVT
jgi:hypothetical protein